MRLIPSLEEDELNSELGFWEAAYGYMKRKARLLIAILVQSFFASNIERSAPQVKRSSSEALFE
jgi:hypothetical protein